MTLDRVLSRLGLASRTESRTAIKGGRIKVNGRIERNPDCWVQPGRDAIQLDGRRVKAARKIYLLLYKPKGVVTSHGDPDGRKTVYDYVSAGAPGHAPQRAGRDTLPWVAPVGRLDKDTSGLLLMTNDTEFADFITSPASRVPKTYLVKVNALLNDATVSRLAAGVEMKRGDAARPENVRRIEDRGKYTWLEIVLTEGKNREVRRMIETVGFKVLKLVRTTIGQLTLAGLQPGAYRELSPGEIRNIKIAGSPGMVPTTERVRR